ncbi:MAG: DNA-binding response regulator [Alphaproteobacteria bacterium]|nr:MAG: DNA-binding response regulator [Alphaproteobacteria bacterium]
MRRCLRVLLVDDEPLALEGLKLRLAGTEDVEIVGCANNGRAAIRAVGEHRPDVMLLDIQMPGIDGLAVVRALMGRPDMPLVIFVTAFDEYAIEAFRTHALDYLLKPVEEERLAEALAHARERLGERRSSERLARLAALIDSLDPESRPIVEALLDDDALAEDTAYLRRLSIKDRGRITIVEAHEIDYIDAAGDYLCIHVGDQTHILRETMKAMEAKLDPRRFQRIHRSAIVNLDRVRAIEPHGNGECFLLLDNGRRLKVSRSYKAVAMRLAP